MPDLFLELFSEEIPARMQARASEDLARLMGGALAPLAPADIRTYAGPRRIALGASVRAGVAESRSSERGPRVAAPEQALAGFLRKHSASRDDLRQEGDFWVLDRAVPGVDAATLIAREMPGLLRRFPWPKSMRWGRSRFTWVRPLRRILCILDGEIVKFDLRDGEDDGHGLASSNLTEGHRFMAPGAFSVASEAAWRDGLQERYVIVKAEDRRQRVWEGVVEKAAARGLTVVPDDGLLDEIAGLVEWPVPLLGRIEDVFMDLPPEVMQVSMRVNQRYFALRDADGKAAPFFAFAANIEADDGGAAIIAGNERVLRARFSDARHFWDLDRTRTLESRVEDLKAVTFHAKIGTQYERALRLERIAGEIAPLVNASPDLSARAGLLCKADLTTGMVGEFPELQGIMGGYYARYDREAASVAEAVRDHYAPRGLDDAVPNAAVSVAVALADKLDQLVQFFGAGEKPTGSGDPFALRRAGLGILRILETNCPHVSIYAIVSAAQSDWARRPGIRTFLLERLRIKWRSEGHSPGVLNMAFSGIVDRIDVLSQRVSAYETFLGTPDGENLKTAYERANSILDKENKIDGPHMGPADPSLFEKEEGEERMLLDSIKHDGLIAREYAKDLAYVQAMERLSRLRGPIDRFFENVTVNDLKPDVRRNRLSLLHMFVSSVTDIIDFSKIEGS